MQRYITTFINLPLFNFQCIFQYLKDNLRQEDLNNNMVGDACDSVNDKDNDGVPDEVFGIWDLRIFPVSSLISFGKVDNCPEVRNTDQLDGLPGLEDGVGDACDDDDDNDGVPDLHDNCRLVSLPRLCMPSFKQSRLVHNPDQRDSNGDGEGDACQDDCDLDAIKNGEDICPCDPSKSVTDLSGLVTHDVGTDDDAQDPPK